ncbi:MAG: inverse autotransporter beta domain-containing protein, partial [Mixta sp.]
MHRLTLSAFSLLLFSSPLLIPDVHAFQTENHVPAAPFEDPARFSAMEQQLPSLGIDDSQENAFSTRLAQMAKSIGEASNSDSDASFGQQAGVWAFNHFRDEVADRLIDEGQSLLSPYGTAQLSLQVDMDGNFVGSGGQLLTPWQDNYQYLTFSQLGVTQTDDGLVGNAGLGQRWVAGNWLLGYNALVDRQFDSGLQRASLGTEAWSDFLRLSANYYAPLGGWRNSSSSQQNRMARGYDITTQGYLPFYRQLGVSVTWEQYLGNNVDLFNNGSPEKNPVSVKVGV